MKLNIFFAAINFHDKTPLFHIVITPQGFTVAGSYTGHTIPFIFFTFCFDSIPLERLNWKIVVISGYNFFYYSKFYKNNKAQ